MKRVENDKPNTDSRYVDKWVKDIDCDDDDYYKKKTLKIVKKKILKTNKPETDGQCDDDRLEYVELPTKEDQDAHCDHWGAEAIYSVI